MSRSLHHLFRSLRAGGLGLALVFLYPALGGAQDTSSAWSASLLRRAAEVADGQNLGDRVFIVLSRTFPHEVAGVFTTRAEADRAQRRSRYLAVLGPLTHSRIELPPPPIELPAPPELDLGPLAGIDGLLAGCRHNKTTSEMRSYCGAGARFRLRDVDSITITTRLKDGHSATVTYPVDSVDAVFFTLDALDKFAFPYYTRLLGTYYAAHMRQDIVRALDSVGR